MTSPTLYAHDLRLAASETGAPSPENASKKNSATGRRRDAMMVLSTTTTTTTTTAAKAPLASSTTASAAAASPSRQQQPPDALDLAIAYLKKRDGIDKVLKIARYAAKFLLAANSSQSKKVAAAVAAGSSPSFSSPAFATTTYAPLPPSPPPPPAATLALLRLDQEPLRKLKAFEGAVGDARKAYRLGKFLQGVDAARRAAPAALRLQPAGVLAFLAAAGDGCYYFLDQFTFFLRAGVIDKRYARRLARAAAACELVGYFGSASLHAAAIAACAQREAELVRALRGARKLDLLTDCRGEEEEADDGEEGLGGEGEEEVGGGEGGEEDDDDDDDDDDEREATDRQRSSRMRSSSGRRKRSAAVAAEDLPAAAAVERELSALARLRRSRERGLAQDACDALLALSDLSEAVAGNPTVLALAGLTSALLGAKKVWGK